METRINVDGDVFFLKNSTMFNDCQTSRVYEKNQIIYQQGDKADHVYYVKKGKVQIYISDQNGSEKILTSVSEGGLFGKASFFDHMPRSSSAKALQKTEIIWIDRKTMSDIISRTPSFALDMLEVLSKTIRLLSGQINTLSFLRADQRIARFLVDRLSGGPDHTSIVCTHEEIAAAVCVSRVTVSKTISKFAQEGWIRPKYGQIQVLQVSPLAVYAYPSDI